MNYDGRNGNLLDCVVGQNMTIVSTQSRLIGIIAEVNGPWIKFCRVNVFGEHTYGSNFAE